MEAYLRDLLTRLPTTTDSQTTATLTPGTPRRHPLQETRRRLSPTNGSRLLRLLRSG